MCWVFARLCRAWFALKAIIITPTVQRKREQLFEQMKKVEDLEMNLERTKVKTAAAQELIQGVLGGRVRQNSGSDISLGVAEAVQALTKGSRRASTMERAIDAVKRSISKKARAIFSKRKRIKHSVEPLQRIDIDTSEPIEDVEEVIDLDKAPATHTSADGT